MPDKSSRSPTPTSATTARRRSTTRAAGRSVAASSCVTSTTGRAAGAPRRASTHSSSATASRASPVSTPAASLATSAIRARCPARSAPRARRSSLAAAKGEPGTDGVDLVATVTCAEPYVVGSGPYRVVAYDYGIKATMLRHLERVRNRRGRPGFDAGERGARPEARRRVPVERSRRPHGGRRSDRQHRAVARRGARSSVSASGISCWG